MLIPEARRAGHSAEAIYFNLDLAGLMGIVDYQRVASEFPPNMLLGEWVFADDLFGDDIPAAADYFDDIFGPMAGGDPQFVAALMRVRGQVARYLDDCVAAIMARRATNRRFLDGVPPDLCLPGGRAPAEGAAIAADHRLRRGRIAKARWGCN